MLLGSPGAARKRGGNHDGAPPLCTLSECFAAAVAIGCAVWSAEAAAQSPYPNRMIRLVVPAAAGGPLDITARAITEKLSINLKQPFVIDNRPGAGGNLGAEDTRQGGTRWTHTRDGPRHDADRQSEPLQETAIRRGNDFRPIAIVTRGGNMLVVHPSLPVTSVAEFVAFARAAAARKEPITYASAGGPGSPGHLVMENFRLRAGFDAIHVPYRSNPSMVTDLLAGQVKAAFVTSSGMMDHVQAGRLRPLAVSHASAHRSPQMCRRSPNRAIPDSRSRTTM